jgi:drug/metabolite transporter (DMT)-like permease
VKLSLLYVHLAVLLFGLAGLFGKWLPISPITIVWWRSLFAVLALGIAVAVAAKNPFALQKKTALILVLLGAVLAAHWVTFFHAIQLSTVAIGLLSFSTFPVIVALLEPLVLAERFRADSLLHAALAFGGVLLVVPSFDPAGGALRGALVGVASGALYAITTVANRGYAGTIDAMTLGLWQNAVGCLVLLPFGPALDLNRSQLSLLAILGIVFTGGAHALFIHGMRDVSARLASIIGTLEPVYGVAAAALLLGEVPTFRTVLGGALVVATVALATKKSG